MQNRDRLRDMRALDYVLFGGVPAVPDPMYGRGDYHSSHASIRHTRSSTDILDRRAIDAGAAISGYIELDLTTWDVVMCDPRQEETEEG